MSEYESSSDRLPFERLAEEFAARLCAGEQPALSEYVDRYPELADEIRELLPALALVEKYKPARPGPDILATALQAPDRGDLPEQLGGHRIVRKLGEGGMGVVYEAVHESLHSHVALKVMHPHYRNRLNYIRRFQTEARSAARLHHTNIVSVFDYGVQDGVCYYAMRYIAGHSLDKILSDLRQLRQENARPGSAVSSTLTSLSRVSCGVAEPAVPIGAEAASEAESDADAALDSLHDSTGSLAGKTVEGYYREVARLGAQIADALAYAHKRGVVHRDIKPPNLILDTLGNLWITDFGLAKFEDGEDISHSHELVGTLRYMAPERFRGLSDPCCDVYALGATLYELATLHPPFEGKNHVELIEQIERYPPVPPRQLDHRVPRDLETIVLKALAKNPHDRFASAEAMSDELRRFVENRPIRSRPIPFYQQFWRWCQRNPGLAAANITAAVLTTVLAVVSTVAAWTFRRSATRSAQLRSGPAFRRESS